MRIASSRVSVVARLLLVCTVLLTLLTTGVPAQAAVVSFAKLKPTRMFVQAGFGEAKTSAYTAGFIWDWNWHKDYSAGVLTGYADASFGRWSTESGDQQGSTWATQVGLTPVLRFNPVALNSRTFIEIGIGANFILPLYRSSEKRFSTEFNFGDHIAFGLLLGEHKQHELAIRLQHFSNGGIDHPNPGENFVQVRYARKW